MKQYTRLASLTFVGFTCWTLFRWCSVKNIDDNAPNYINENSKNEGVIDSLPRFRLSGVVNETLENQLYDSLTALEKSLAYHAANVWPRLIWQTSPSKEEIGEMTSWKIETRFCLPGLCMA